MSHYEWKLTALDKPDANLLACNWGSHVVLLLISVRWCCVCWKLERNGKVTLPSKEFRKLPNLLLEPLMERRTIDHCSFQKSFSESLRSEPLGPSVTADLVDTWAGPGSHWLFRNWVVWGHAGKGCQAACKVGAWNSLLFLHPWPTPWVRRGAGSSRDSQGFLGWDLSRRRAHRIHWDRILVPYLVILSMLCSTNTLAGLDVKEKVGWNSRGHFNNKSGFFPHTYW